MRENNAGKVPNMVIFHAVFGSKICIIVTSK